MQDSWEFAGGDDGSQRGWRGRTGSSADISAARRDRANFAQSERRGPAGTGTTAALSGPAQQAL